MRQNDEPIGSVENVLIITGPSAVGKSTISEILQQKMPNIKKIISTTSRTPRLNEVDGVDYIFISEEAFEKKISNGDFLEFTFYNDNHYGILNEQTAVHKEEIMLFVVDTIGAKTLQNHFPFATTVFIKPPSIKILEERITNRNANTPDQIQWRIAKAKQEIHEADNFDYVVINDDIDSCVEEIMNLIKL